jgi:hypothetical protein
MHPSKGIAKMEATSSSQTNLPILSESTVIAPRARTRSVSLTGSGIVNGSLNDVEKLADQFSGIVLENIKTKKPVNLLLNLSIKKNSLREDDSSPVSGKSSMTRSTSSSDSSRSLSTDSSRLQDSSIVDRIISQQTVRPGFWDHLAVASDLIIGPKDLFRNLYHRISEAINTNHDSVKTLLEFCIFWVQENKEAVIVWKSNRYITKIIEVVEENSSEEIKKQGQRLKLEITKTRSHPFEKTVKAEQESKKTPRYEDVSKANSKLLIGSLIDTHMKGMLDKRYIEVLAADLMHYQLKAYMTITAHDFIELKWNQNSSRMSHYLRFLDSISTMVGDQIGYFERGDEKLMVAEFFLEIATESLRKKDFATAYEISFTILKLFKSSRKTKLSKLKSFEQFFQSKIQKKYSKLMQKNSLYIPVLRQFKEMISDVFIKEESALGLEKVYRITTEFCTPQARWKTREVATSLQTNIGASLTINAISADILLEEMKVKFDQEEESNS